MRPSSIAPSPSESRAEEGNPAGLSSCSGGLRPLVELCVEPARRWPERGQSGRQVAAPCKRGHRQRSALLGGLQVAIPFQERGPDREPHPASRPSAARCEGADGGGRVAAQAPGLLLTWPFPVSRRALASRPQKFPSRVHRAPRPARSPWCPAHALLATPRRCPPCPEII